VLKLSGLCIEDCDVLQCKSAEGSGSQLLYMNIRPLSAFEDLGAYRIVTYKTRKLLLSNGTLHPFWMRSRGLLNTRLNSLSIGNWDHVDF
jgi:hypothetical protein